MKIPNSCPDIDGVIRIVDQAIVDLRKIDNTKDVQDNLSDIKESMESVRKINERLRDYATDLKDRVIAYEEKFEKLRDLL